VAHESILEGLLDASIVVVEVDLARDALGALTPEETAGMSRAHPDRLLEYRAGRHCARVALARLGLAGASIPRNEDRSPIWPAGFVGSITHTRKRQEGWCAAAVARSADFPGVGIDGELDEPLEVKLWSRVLLPAEQAWIEARPDGEQGFWGKLFFSAKEATYKCQYPLTSTFLEFADVEITVEPVAATFDAVLRREAGALRAGHAFHGRYARREGIIATAVAVR
jgi:4'-phosphopantetheinyl transferase EntD